MLSCSGPRPVRLLPWPDSSQGPLGPMDSDHFPRGQPSWLPVSRTTWGNCPLRELLWLQAQPFPLCPVLLSPLPFLPIPCSPRLGPWAPLLCSLGHMGYPPAAPNSLSTRLFCLVAQNPDATPDPLQLCPSRTCCENLLWGGPERDGPWAGHSGVGGGGTPGITQCRERSSWGPQPTDTP